MCPELEMIERELREVTAGLTSQQLQACRDGKWSSAQVLEHLMITYGTTAQMGRKLLAKDDVQPLSRTLQQRVAQFVLITIGYFPSGRKAPDFTIPKGLDCDLVMRQIGENLRAMDEVLNQAEAKWGRSVAVANHPVLGPLSVPQWRRFHWIHSHHHFKQIRALVGTQQSAAHSA